MNGKAKDEVMTLDEAIKVAEEIATHCEAFENQERVHDVRWMSRSRCAKEHRQLAEWFKELKAARRVLEGYGIYYHDGRHYYEEGIQ